MNTPSEIIRIRPHVLGDIPRLHDAIIESAEALARSISWYHPAFSISDAQKWVISQVNAFVRGDEYGFAIVGQQDRFLGACGISHIDRVHRYGNIGYWTRLACIGKGVATIGVRQLVDWAYANTSLCRLEILCAAENMAGRRVAEKAGAAFVGILEQRLCLQGRMRDAAMYVFLRP